ncbi:MAG: AAA family ATPase [Desulfosarcina sp.]|nr:AAA family ATPase [Desulfosarcina sp.]MBC2765132.1 AAA family ATPase [Desulfosarcina sp.]
MEQTDDIGALPLLNFYRCYRAMVRCKVSCFRLREIGSRSANHDTLRAAAERYLAMAHGYAAAFSRPILWMVCGLPASGKSTIARALAEVFDISVIRSDVIRKKLFAGSSGLSDESAFEQGLYSAYATEVTYERMFDLAQENLKKGKSVVIDATFSRAARRAEVLRIAKHRQSTPVFVECRAAEPILAARLLKRETEPSVSDARLVHLEDFKNRFEPIARIGNEIHIPVDTGTSPAVCLRQILLSDSLWDGVTRKGGKDV